MFDEQEPQMTKSPWKVGKTLMWSNAYELYRSRNETQEKLTLPFGEAYIADNHIYTYPSGRCTKAKIVDLVSKTPRFSSEPVDFLAINAVMTYACFVIRRELLGHATTEIVFDPKPPQEVLDDILMSTKARILFGSYGIPQCHDFQSLKGSVMFCIHGHHGRVDLYKLADQIEIPFHTNHYAVVRKEDASYVPFFCSKGTPLFYDLDLADVHWGQMLTSKNSEDLCAGYWLTAE